MPQKGFDGWVGRVYGAMTDSEATRGYDAWADSCDHGVDSVGDRLR